MFWAFISLVALAYTFARIGALAVMAKVLTAALLCAGLVIVVLAIALLWRAKFSKRVH